MDDKSFFELCKSENEKLSSIVDKEEVPNETAFTSQIIVNNMLVDGVGDALLYASALNVLNAYVKQSKECKKAAGYYFKSKVSVLLGYIINNPNDYIEAEIQEDNGTNLAIINIFGIQFSFHNITVNEKYVCLKAKDPDNPRLVWDGIRKQACSVTLFDFSYKNEYGRTYKMLDGSDFVVCTDSLVNEFKRGIKTFLDIRRTIYKKNYPEKPVISYSFDVDEYPAKSKYLVSLKSYDAKTFLDKISDKTLISELNESYQQKTGQYLSQYNILQAKYALMSLQSLLTDAEINPSAGVYLVYNKLPFRQAIMVFLTSCEENGDNNIICLELLSWTSVKKADGNYVSVLDGSSGTYHTILHPGYHVINQMLDQINRLPESGSISFDHCIFLYDLIKTEENDIVSGMNDMTAAIFYDSDRDSLIDYLKPVIRYGNGTDLLCKLDAFFDSMSLNSDGSLSYEHYLAVENCIDCLKTDSRTLNIINYRKARNNADLFNYISQQFNDSHLAFNTFTSAIVSRDAVSTDIALFVDCIPQGDIIDQVKNIVIICDLYAPSVSYSNEIDDVIDCAYDKDISVHRADIVDVLGFADGGNGNNYILRHLDITEIAYRHWLPASYPISVVEDPDDLSIDNGIKIITILETTYYDPDCRLVFSPVGEKESIYQELLDAPNGVKLIINNQSLKNHFRDNLSKHMDYAKWASEPLDSDLSVTLDFIKKHSVNSSDYNKYLSMAIKCIHEDAWLKLDEDSHDWIISALSNYYHTTDIDTSMDYSGVTLLVSKTFESELNKRISVNYVDYLKNKYGDLYIYELPDSLAPDPAKDKKPMDPNFATLGSFPYFMGLDPKGAVNNEKAHNNFIAYCNDVLLVHPENADNVLAELCDIIFYVRLTFRNPSAHKHSISYETATDCITYSITEKRMLGVIMDMFRE